MSYRRYPSAGANPSIASNGSTAPAFSTLVSGETSHGEAYPLLVDDLGTLQVDLNQVNGVDLSTSPDIIGGVKNGLDVNLLSGGVIGNTFDNLAAPYQNSAVSVGFLNGGLLVPPAMNVLDNTLIVDATQSGSVPVAITGSTGTVQVDLETLHGGYLDSANPVPVQLSVNNAGATPSNPVPSGLYNPSSGVQLSVGAGTADSNTLRTINFTTTGAGLAVDYGIGVSGTATTRTSSNIALNGVNASIGQGTNDAGTQRVAANIMTASGQVTGTAASGRVTAHTQLYNSSNGIMQGQNTMASSLPVAISSDQSKIPTYQPDTTANGSITSTGSVSITTSGAGTIGVQISGTWTGSLTLEASIDNANWYATPGVALTSGGSSYTFSANNIIQVNCSGLPYIRMRGNTVTSGTAVINMVANQSVGNVMVDNPIPSGTNTIGNIANISGTVSLPTGAATETTLFAINTKTPALGQSVMASSSPVVIASNQSSVPANINQVGGSALAIGQQLMAASIPVVFPSDMGNMPMSMPDINIVGQAAQTAIINNIISATAGLAATDAAGYRSATVQVISTGTAGTFIFEGSNDNVNFQTIPVYNQATVTAAPVVAAITASASSNVYTLPIQTRYIRLRIVTTITGGSIQAFTRISQSAWSAAVTTVVQSAAANLNVAVGSGTITSVTSITNGVKITSAKGQFIRNDYTVTPVTTSAYVQLIASTSSAYSAVEVFDSSGQTLVFAIGAAGSEVDQFIITPGGNGRVPFTLATAQRISVKALSATASVGEIDINFYV